MGRGIPSGWLAGDKSITVTDFPTVDGRRLGLSIRSSGGSVRLELSGQAPAGPVLFQVPAFVHNIASASSGTIDRSSGTVTVGPGTREVTVELRHSP